MHFLMGMFWLGAVLAMISLYAAAAYWVYMAARWCGATRGGPVAPRKPS